MVDRSTEPQTLIDPATGRPILMAPARQKRPILTDQSPGDTRCPFCPGNEGDTPPTRGQLDRDGGGTDAWVARAFDNLYPAARDHEVIAEGRAHSQVPAEVPAAHWARAMELAGQRLVEIEGRDGIGCAFWFKNVGRMAGASIAHNHSQILGLTKPPPRLLKELETIGPEGDDPGFLADELATASAEGRLAVDGPFAVFCPRRPKLPFETWLAPRDATRAFEALDADALGALGEALHSVFAAFQGAFDGAPFNAWLHRVPGTSFHWHFEFQPRTGFLAGLELGGDMYINSVSPRKRPNGYGALSNCERSAPSHEPQRPPDPGRPALADGVAAGRADGAVAVVARAGCPSVLVGLTHRLEHLWLVGHRHRVGSAGVAAVRAVAPGSGTPARGPNEHRPEAASRRAGTPRPPGDGTVPSRRRAPGMAVRQRAPGAAARGQGRRARRRAHHGAVHARADPRRSRPAQGAARQCGIVLREEPDHAFGRAQQVLGEILLRDGRTDEAIAALTQHADAHSANRGSAYSLAMAYLQAGNKAEAARWLGEAGRNPRAGESLSAEDALVRARARVRLWGRGAPRPAASSDSPSDPGGRP